MRSFAAVVVDALMAPNSGLASAGRPPCRVRVDLPPLEIGSESGHRLADSPLCRFLVRDHRQN
jgi:hypothetical protein